jgi:hypothetical protein
MTKVKKIRALLGFQRTSDTDLLKFLNTVHDGLNGNPAFPTPPIDTATFKTEIDQFSVLIIDAEDGGKRAISAKNKQREALIKTVTLLGHHVESACNDDMAAFNTSGFIAASSVRTPAQPLSGVEFDWIDRGPVAGSIEVKPRPIPGAVSFDLPYGVVLNGAPPAMWTNVQLPSSKKFLIENLTPGTNYAFQVRALGKLGYTDYCDSKIFICG